MKRQGPQTGKAFPLKKQKKNTYLPVLEWLAFALLNCIRCRRAYTCEDHAMFTILDLLYLPINSKLSRLQIKNFCT